MEYSIQRLLPVITREREKHRKRRKLLDDINLHLEEGLKLLGRSRTLLGEDDPLTARLEAAMHYYATARGSIEHFVERGAIIEEF